MSTLSAEKNSSVFAENKKIRLRDRALTDLNDYILWNTLLTEWQNWDAPWEKRDFDEKLFCDNFTPSISNNTDQIRKRAEFDAVIDGNFKHIGWLGSYLTGENKDLTAIGIDIPDPSLRGKGFGAAAFSMWIEYLMNSNNLEKIYFETWSGNIRMIELGKKLGFTEDFRVAGLRVVNGGIYDKVRFVKNR